MFKRKKTPLAVDTLLGEHTVFTGNVETEGSMKVLGKIEGDIRASGDVHIEAGSRIIGKIFAENLYLSGHVEGNIAVKGLLHLLSTARLFGDIEVSSMVTDEGAVLQGNCKMVESATTLDNHAKNGQSPKPGKPQLRKSKDDD